jgi:hypothetical protein
MGDMPLPAFPATPFAPQHPDLVSIIGTGPALAVGDQLVFRNCGTGTPTDVTISGFGPHGQIYISFIGDTTTGHFAAGRGELMRRRSA